MGTKSYGYPQERCQDANSRVKEALDCLTIHVVTRDHQDPKFLVSLWSVDSHTLLAAYGKFGPTLEDVLNLTVLLIRGNQFDECDFRGGK